MNAIVRNLGVVLCGALSSFGMTALLIWLEASSGHTLFGYTVLTYIPVGAIGAGLAGSLGYVVGSMALRTRPMQVVLAAVVLVAAGAVFLGESAEFAIFMGAKNETKDLASFGQFLGAAVSSSPLKFSSGKADGGDSTTAASSTDSTPSAASTMMPQTGAPDANVDGMAAGVQGMLNAPDVTNSAPARRLTQIDASMQSLGKGMENHNALLTITAVELMGFVLGGLVAFALLRRISYCEDCMVFLSPKGEQVRYFDTSDRMQTAVNEFSALVRERKVRESIREHSTHGVAQKNRFVEFASAVEISQCKGCARHRVKFVARRKKGSSWEEIPVLQQVAFTLEPVEVVRA